MLYKKIIKPLLFLFPADKVHAVALITGRILGSNSLLRAWLKMFFYYEHASLYTDILGLKLKSPVGLAAGFDYDADLMQVTPALSFGFGTIGTVTLGAYQGNPAPMLGRLPKSQSLLVNKGFKSAGMNAILKKIDGKIFEIPIGMSVGATNRRYENFNEMTQEVVEALLLAQEAPNINYLELNISCPNLINIGHFEKRFDESEGLKELLLAIAQKEVKKPLLVKMPLEKTKEETLSLCRIMIEFPWINGVILSNLAKDRSNIAFDKQEIMHASLGNFSGKPTEKKSNELISAVYKTFGDRLTIIGCGGIFSGSDAYEKICRGASALQMITGMVYLGPAVIGGINRELVELLVRDGYKSVKEAVGTKSNFV